MADMLIKGMEMPKDGILRLVIFPNGRVDEINIYNEACMSTDSQAVAIPEHGRLIDADELQDVLSLVLSLVISNELTEKEISLVHRTIDAISKAINDLDIVLEATE